MLGACHLEPARTRHYLAKVFKYFLGY